ncbi:hypothetical protein [Microbacterium sp.]|uniref:hypothetical protein n=1 Tax=Microbacterium sp. TaxID=51671 RepID=UPI003F9DA7C2
MTRPDEEYERFLGTVSHALTDKTPITKSFVESLRMRASLGEGGSSGTTVETLSADIVSVLGALEVRMNDLEEQLHS